MTNDTLDVSSQDADQPEAGSQFDFFDPNSPLAPYYFRASHVFAALLVAAILFFFNFTPLVHSDVWGHLKIGEWIAHNHRLPDHELFSPFADSELPASNFQWLAQLISFETYRLGAWLAGGSPLRQMAGGVDMLRTLHSLLEAAKALFLVLAFRRLTGSLPLAIAGVVLVFAFSLYPSSIQRPQAFAEPLFAALLWLVICGAGCPAPLTWKQIAAIAALMVVWTNTHGSFLIGLALIGIFWFGRLLSVALDRGVKAAVLDDAAQNLFIAGLVSTTALSLLNPHGVYAIPDVLAFAKNSNVLSMHEWKPLDFSAGSGGHIGYMILLSLITLTQLAAPRVFTPTQLLLLVVFGLGPLLQERLMTWWVMLVPVIVLPTCAELTRLPAALEERWTSLLSLRKTIIAAGIVLVAVVWTNGVQLAFGNAPTPLTLSTSPLTLWPISEDLLKGQIPPSPDDAKLLAANPLAAALKEGLKTYPDHAFRGVIFTPEALGDTLVWSLPPKAPVMVYSHVHVFPTPHWQDYMTILFAQPGYKQALDRHHINLVIAPADDRAELFEKLKADPDWILLLQPGANNRRLFAALRKQPLENLP